MNKELAPRELASYLRSKGYYVSRHANWLIVMKDNKMAGMIYVYPSFSEATVIEERPLDEAVEWLEGKGFKVTRRAPLYRLS